MRTGYNQPDRYYGNVSWVQLKEAISKLKNMNTPGMHDGDGTPVKLLTATEVLDELCYLLGYPTVVIKPPYEFNRNGSPYNEKIHWKSNVTGRMYNADVQLSFYATEPDKKTEKFLVEIPNQGWKAFDSEDDAKEFLGTYERIEGVTTQDFS